jgi:adenosylhomocysteine nucleosidase
LALARSGATAQAGAMIPSLLAIVGMKREAALVAAPGVVTAVGGGDGAALLGRLEALDERPRAVLSVGLAGALSPTLAVGDWIVADRVCHAGEVVPIDPRLLAQLQALTQPLGGVHTGALAAGDAMVVDGSSKAALHAATGALAVDMESHVAARFARARSLPFAALRIISDAADHALPKAAQAGMKKDGGMDILAVLRELAKDPRQLPALIRTGREAEVAFQRLKLLGRHDLLGRLGVGDPDFG